MKYFAIVGLVLILGSLGTALFFMLSGSKGDRKKSSSMMKALAVRIGLSVFVFIGILVAWKLGYVQPSGIPAGK
jgi:surface polysaccharide O-acyltransferase-like enzyme